MVEFGGREGWRPTSRRSWGSRSWSPGPATDSSSPQAHTSRASCVRSGISIDHNRFDHPSFYLGERSRAGWWSYYPFTMLAKSTIPELSLAAGGLVVAAATVRRRGFSGLAADRERARMLWFGLATAAALVASPICIGHR